MSATAPPPSVSGGDGRRTTKRSPTARASGVASRSCTQPEEPGSRVGASSNETRAITSAVPACTFTASSWVIASEAEPRTVRRADSTETGASVPGLTTTIPRSSSSFSTPAIFNATRLPGLADSSARLWVWIPRTRARWPVGRISISSPTANAPSTSVPVTTVPKPVSVKARSIARRGLPRSRRAGAVASTDTSAATSSASPVFADAETSTIGAPASAVP